MPTDMNLSQDTLALFEAIENNNGVECEKVPDIFFPEDIFSTQGTIKSAYRLVREMEETAREICLKCPVMALCLKVGFYEDYGIFGGTTPKQRIQLRRDKQI
jgi:hypothetical protein